MSKEAIFKPPKAIRHTPQPLCERNITASVHLTGMSIDPNSYP